MLGIIALDHYSSLQYSSYELGVYLTCAAWMSLILTSKFKVFPARG